MDTRIDDVIEFWFGQSFARWYAKDPAFDEEIRSKFGALQADAAAGKLDIWIGTPRGELALLVLLDQFSRNLFRDSPRAFATDGRALAITLAMKKRDELSVAQQLVSLLPFQHAEDLALQEQGIALYQAIVDAHPEDKGAAMSLDYAKRHRDIIARFGRFPHRNTVLGRASTPDELAFLQQPGSSF